MAKYVQFRFEKKLSCFIHFHCILDISVYHILDITADRPFSSYLHSMNRILILINVMLSLAAYILLILT